MTISEITSYLETISPLSLQEDYDNCGLLVGDSSLVFEKALLCLDITEKVMEEAILCHCNLIISHHPLIFKGLKKLTSEISETAIIKLALINDIAIYAIHTNLDNTLNGLNSYLFTKLGITKFKILSPKPGLFAKSAGFFPNDSAEKGRNDLFDSGAGIIGEFDFPLGELDFLQLVKTRLGLSVIRHSALRSAVISKVALCSGSGSFLLNEAARSGADAYLTADLKYHDFFSAERKLLLLDIGHYESEHGVKEWLYAALIEKFPTFAFLISEVNTNPVHYF